MNFTKTRNSKNVLIVDDHPIVLVGIKNIVEGIDGTGDILTATNGKDALQSVITNDIGICITDLELPDMSGFELIKRIKEKAPDTYIIIETMHDEIWTIRKMVESEANAIILKQSDTQDLKNAIYAAFSGTKYYSKTILQYMKKTESEAQENTLSERELDILRYIAQGLKSNEIAEILYISVNTIEFHRKNIMAKLCARNSSDMIVKAIKKGLINI